MDATQTKNVAGLERRIKSLIVAVIVLFCCIVFSIFGLIWIRSNTVTHSVNKVNSEAVARSIATCEQGNVFRASDVATWNFVLGFFDQKDPRVQQAEAYIRAKDAPRNCEEITKNPNAPTTTIPVPTTVKIKP